MPQNSHTILMNAFRPAQEVDEPRFFAGRARQVADLTDALHVKGSVPLIYGDRGLGKTSLAIQMMYVALGEVELLSALRLQDRGFNQAERYVAFRITCTDATLNFDGLIQQLINAAEETDFRPRERGYQARHLSKRTTNFTWSLRVLRGGSTREFVPETARASYQEYSPSEKLQYLIDLVWETYRQPALFVIDEVDRLQDTRGLASFIKATSNERAKFVLVGIASSIGDLLADHQSIERSLVPVRVPLMDELELRQIIDNAQDYLCDRGVPIIFDRPARSLIIESAAGFPWLVHVIGQSALRKAIGAGRRYEVIHADVLDTIFELPKNRFAQQFSDLYSQLVRDSPQREKVLRAFANWYPDDIPTSEIYRILRSDLGVTNPSAYKSQLASQDFGSVIYTPPGRHRGEVRFANPIFKVYVRLRPSIYENVDREVRAAFKPAED